MEGDILLSDSNRYIQIQIFLDGNKKSESSHSVEIFKLKKEKKKSRRLSLVALAVLGAFDETYPGC